MSKEFNEAWTAGLVAEANNVMAESQLLVPRDTGNLASTGTVPKPKENRGKVRVSMQYGGARAPYAVRQHEDLGLRHTSPQSAKYLEIPFLQKAGSLGPKMAARMRIAGRKRLDPARLRVGEKR